jgi:hypothetical protein
MIDLLSRMPGWLIAFCIAFPFLAIAIGLVLVSAGYVLALKLSVALDETREIRNRKL